MGMYDRPATVARNVIPKGRRVIVCSDIHGNIPYFKGLLEKLNFSNEDELIINGDFLEKGEESLGMLRLLMGMSRQGNVHTVMGNCDDWSGIFTTERKWLDGLSRYVNFRKSGLLWDMIQYLDDNPKEVEDFSGYRYKLKEFFAEEFDFLSKLPQAIETDKYVFAHAAVYPKPLESHSIGDFLRCDRFLDLGHSFQKWVVVGHYPVVLYGENSVCANPIVLPDRHIISIDGACVLKDDGQLNALVLPDIDSEDFSFEHYDHFPLRRVKQRQEGSKRSYYIRWGDSRVQVLIRGEEFSHCRHVRTGYEMDILTKYLFSGEDFTDCNDCTDYVLPLESGNEVSVVEECSRGYFVKHKGVSGWYYGELE